MGRVSVFNSVSLDGYFTGENGNLQWAHGSSDDPEWNDYVSGNAQGGGALLMGRVTYDMMLSYWPTPQAKENDPVVAKGMNEMAKYVFSRSLDRATWENTTIVKGDVAAEVRKLKNEVDDITILGSGSIIARLADTDLVDSYTIVVVPVILGTGRTMFEGASTKPALKLTETRAFKNGNVVLTYET